MFKITKLEKKIFDLLLETLQHSKLDIKLRVAGGWVRDKLLGYECNDIDIAIDKIMGKDFVVVLHNHLIEKKIESHGFGVIKKNAEQSKHLETATIQIFGLWIDFVNLRGEEYTEDSRIPTQIIGTPEDDAYRRDFTINSLFYNINENKVEDYTKKGIEDLKNRIIRTPLCPRRTFLDDPLRILRGFRFSARYDYEIEKEAYEFICSDKEIKLSFKQKISKERIGKEFESNFLKPEISVNPFKFFDYLYESGFMMLILDTQSEEKVFKGYKLAKKLNNCNVSFKEEFEYYLKESKDDLNFDIMVALSYLSLITYNFFDFKIKKMKNKKCYHVIREEMKLKRKAAEYATKLQICIKDLEKLYFEKKLDLLNLAIWQKNSESLWRLSDKIFFNIIYSEEVHGEYLDLNLFFENHKIPNFFKTKTLLDGKDVKKIFKFKGKEIKNKLEEVLIWQIYNPLSTKQDYIKNVCKINNYKED